MDKYRILNLTIIYKDSSCYDALRIISEPIIVKKRLKSYKEISTGIKFKPKLVDEDFTKKFYNHSVNSLIYARDESGNIPPSLNASRFNNYSSLRELRIHDVIREKVEKYGFVFIVNKSKNELNNLKTATLEEKDEYLNNIYSTKFYELSHRYNRGNQKQLQIK